MRSAHGHEKCLEVRSQVFGLSDLLTGRWGPSSGSGPLGNQLITHHMTHTKRHASGVKHHSHNRGPASATVVEDRVPLDGPA